MTMPILTHLLLPEAYGIAAIAGTFVALVTVIVLAGMDMSYARTFHARSPVERSSIEVFAWRYTLAAGIAGGVILMLFWAAISETFLLPDYLAVLLGAGVF
ncbi:MAG: oligosaccharide flippase family protein [Gammaproteobacteria bacterium]|nr:oligosaccharide flippase family protein [Gammaproteobacteria bacterium]